mmetsp:Transcript_35464/g.106780  ORF Transcript_35464/g.106780 Transcript_35464/m.106780 type:complete len:285 (+) Transcript_35464:670-1524(+)
MVETTRLEGFERKGRHFGWEAHRRRRRGSDNETREEAAVPQVGNNAVTADLTRQKAAQGSIRSIEEVLKPVEVRCGRKCRRQDRGPPLRRKAIEEGSMDDKGLAQVDDDRVVRTQGGGDCLDDHSCSCKSGWQIVNAEVLRLWCWSRGGSGAHSLNRSLDECLGGVIRCPLQQAPRVEPRACEDGVTVQQHHRLICVQRFQHECVAAIRQPGVDVGAISEFAFGDQVCWLLQLSERGEVRVADRREVRVHVNLRTHNLEVLDEGGTDHCLATLPARSRLFEEEQ